MKSAWLYDYIMYTSVGLNTTHLQDYTTKGRYCSVAFISTLSVIWDFSPHRPIQQPRSNTAPQWFQFRPRLNRHLIHTVFLKVRLTVVNSKINDSTTEELPWTWQSLSFIKVNQSFTIRRVHSFRLYARLKIQVRWIPLAAKHYNKLDM